MAWCLGLLLDVLEATPLGTNALGMALIAFLVLTIHQRLRMYPIPQQCLMVFLLLGINQMLVHFIKQLLGADTAGFSYLWPALTSAVAWPFVSGLLDRLNRKLG
jgi:rod shape-determining protein MreD